MSGDYFFSASDGFPDPLFVLLPSGRNNKFITIFIFSEEST